MKRSLVAAMAVVGVVLALSGCAASGPRLSITATPRSAEMDTPLAVRVTGLSGREVVSVEITSQDSDGVQWRGDATYESSRAGTLDTATAVPRPGSGYSGAAEAGLVAGMRPVGGGDVFEYAWSDEPATFTITARADGQKASTSVQRSTFPRDVPSAAPSLSLSVQGFIGTYTPAPGAGLHPAVLTFGGSEGGDSPAWIDPVFASHGISALSIAYFREPGLPQTLSDIPLEYFAKALAWLRAQPGVDPHHVWVVGDSRGSEAAELLGVWFPTLVDGVIAGVPGNVVLCGFPGCTGSAWTLHGIPLPYTQRFGPGSAGNPAAIIPVGRIQAPFLTICGGDDDTWYSCPDAQAMTALLVAAGDRYPHESLEFPHAGHAIGMLPAGEPVAGTVRFTGPSPAADVLAAAKAWPAVIAFIHANS